MSHLIYEVTFKNGTTTVVKTLAEAKEAVAKGGSYKAVYEVVHDIYNKDSTK